MVFIMRRNIQPFTQQEYDLLVVGGGINGAAIAHMAALNGLKTALVEKNDFASGTSSKSTKLIHGGLRYLENLEFGLVRESLKERFIQLKSAPHLVKPLAFAIPLYEGSSRPAWLIKLGVWFYDYLSGKYLIKKHQYLSKADFINDVKGIEERNLLGAVTYYDAQMNDARLCLENVLSAVERGAHAANHLEVQSFLEEKGRIKGVIAYDHIESNTLAIRAQKIVCAVGPWTNKFLEKNIRKGVIDHSPAVRLTKGVHIVYNDQLAPYALLIPTQKDRRVFFIIPWMGYSLIGTTDTDFSGDPDQVRVDQEDIDYLLAEMKRIFPKREFPKDKIISTFAGLRPLVFERGAPSRVSRQHTIEESPSGVVYVIGGKYTTYRKIAEDTLKKITNKRLVNTEAEYPLYGRGKISEQEIKETAVKYSLTKETVEYFIDLYGVKYRDVLTPADQSPELLKPLCSCSLALEAQVVYALKVEMACTEEDILYRRLSLGYFPCKDGRCRDVIKYYVLK